ncbi:MAG: glucose-1-phosphate adenylyltransferase subunit GlgD [Clostridia bacterium]|nr:glucose-1-phosphate adenylyltransferase subunit GlgD [Clostridia bacterium]
MMNALGIIFSDHYSESTQNNELTRSRTPSSLPFAGRFRTIDFAISCMAYAGIRDIGIICKENYGSLIDHIGNGEDWDLNLRKGGIRLLTPLSRPENHTIMTRGRLDALRSIKQLIKDSRTEYVVMGFGGTLANIDLDAMLAFHIEKDAYITVAYSNIPAGKGEMIVYPAADGKLEKVGYQQNESGVADYALGTIIMGRADLLEFLDEADNNDYTNLHRELIQRQLGCKAIYGYHHEGYARVIRTVEEYYAVSMDMLTPALKNELFCAERPILTKVKDMVPTLYGFNAVASNSLIADGCVINGTVKNSILFRGVTVEEGAVVEDSIIMQNGVIGKDAVVCRTITDKNVTVSEGAKVQGAAALPFVIGKGKTV